jgi:cystathionine beta-lyase
VLEALRRQLEHGVLGYEMPQKALRATVAERMRRLYGWQVDPDAVLATPGIVAGMHVAAFALGQPGQGLLVQPPVYPPFLSVAGHAGLATQLAPLQEAEAAGSLRYHIDFQCFRQALHADGVRTALFLLCHPHNPTGQEYAPEELRRMAELCLEQGVPLVSDEIHSELLLGGTRHVPVATLSPEIERNTITLVSPSKSFNVPGMFCGFAIIPDPALREKFRKAMERLAQHVASPSLISAQAALSGGCDDWLEALRRQLTANRDWLLEQLGRRLPEIRATVPDATYLAWLDCRRLPLEGRTPFEFFLERGKVALNQGEDFGPGGAGFARLNFGTTPALLAEVVARMERALDGGR